MKHCPAADCPFARRHRRAAEYRDDVMRCSDCGAGLAFGPAPVIEKPRKEGPRHAPPWLRAAVTLAVPAALWGAAQVTLPGVDLDQMRYGSLQDLFSLRSTVSIVSLGIVPFLSAAVLVELAALVVPGWRELRISGPDGRRRLARASMILGVLLATLQGFWLARQIEYTGLAVDGGLAFRWTATATLVAASCGVVALAWLVDRHGLGSGFSIVIVSAMGPPMWRFGEHLVNAFMSQIVSPLGGLVVLGTLGVLVLATIMVLDAHRGWLAFLPGRTPGPRRAALRLPASGTVPIELAATLLMLPAMIAGWTGLGEEWAMKIVPGTKPFVIAELLLILGGTLLFAWLFNRRAEPALRAQISSAWVRSALYLALLVLGMTLIARLGFVIPLGTALVAVSTAVGLDLVGEWRARRATADLVPVWPLHRVYVLDAALGALERAGIPAFARGAHHRALLQFFGPYVPITILVPTARADEAERLLRSLSAIEFRE